MPNCHLRLYYNLGCLDSGVANTPKTQNLETKISPSVLDPLVFSLFARPLWTG